MDVQRTFNVTAANLSVTRKVFDAVGRGAQGMFPAPIVGGEINAAGSADAYCSTGLIDPNNPVVLGRAAVKALNLPGVTEAEIDQVFDGLDLTEDDARQRARRLNNELGATISAIDWVQPTGSEDAIEKGAYRKHNGKTWVSLQDDNVFEPGVASWREVWATATDTPPNWIQPVGSEDAYRTGERVTHNGTTWHTLRDFNTREPGTFDAGWIDENAGGGGDEWAAGVAYTIGDVVTYEGSEYECRQSHTSIVGWEPPNVLALWLPL